MNLVALCCAAVVQLRCSTNPTLFVEQKFLLSSSFRCEQICNFDKYGFGHTLFCYLSQSQKFNKPTLAQLLVQVAAKFIRIFAMHSITLCWLLKSDLNVQQPQLRTLVKLTFVKLNVHYIVTILDQLSIFTSMPTSLPSQ